MVPRLIASMLAVKSSSVSFSVHWLFCYQRLNCQINLQPLLHKIKVGERSEKREAASTRK